MYIFTVIIMGVVAFLLGCSMKRPKICYRCKKCKYKQNAHVNFNIGPVIKK